VDGFLLKHLRIWPFTLDKNNLFEQQKIFLIYLMGIIPEQQDWQVQTEYQKEYNAIKNLKEVEIDKTEIDLAGIQGRNVEDIKKEKLSIEKAQRIQELNKKFGIKTDEKDYVQGGINLPKYENPVKDNSQRDQLWDILHGKGILKKPGGSDGL
jgi:hypothetical protein